MGPHLPLGGSFSELLFSSVNGGYPPPPAPQAVVRVKGENPQTVPHRGARAPGRAGLVSGGTRQGALDLEEGQGSHRRPHLGQ